MDYEDKNFHTENLVRLINQHGSDEDKIAIQNLFTHGIGEISPQIMKIVTNCIKSIQHI